MLKLAILRSAESTLPVHGNFRRKQKSTCWRWLNQMQAKHTSGTLVQNTSMTKAAKDTSQQLYSMTLQMIVFWQCWQQEKENLKHTWDWGIRLKHNSEEWWGTIRLLEMVEVGGASEVWQRAPVLCQLKTTLWYCTASRLKLSPTHWPTHWQGSLRLPQT